MLTSSQIQNENDGENRIYKNFLSKKNACLFQLKQQLQHRKSYFATFFFVFYKPARKKRYLNENIKYSIS
jgi:hypothetical protein